MTLVDHPLQLSIFAHLEVEPTIAMRRGDAYVTQCAQCGVVCAVPGKPAHIGACPVCNGGTWWRQGYDSVGGIRTVPA